MSEAKDTRRRWFQFGLRGLCVAVTIAAASTAFWAYHIRWIRQRQNALNTGQCWLEGVDLDSGGSLPGALIRAPGFLRVFGENGYQRVWWNVPRGSVQGLKLEDRILNQSEQAEFDRIKQLFPEAEVGESWPE